MPDDKIPDEKSPDSKKTKTKGADPAPVISELPGGGLVGSSATADLRPLESTVSVSGPMPTGSIDLNNGAPPPDPEVDVTKALNTPAFGNVLVAVGNAVAASQKALDQSVVDTVNKLKDIQIDVVTQVVQELNDDGLPEGKATLITNKVSVLNYFTPTFHEWKDVTITMDLVVGEYDAKQGFTFANQQSNTTVGGGVSWAGSFSGSFSVQHASVSQSVQTNAQQVSEWSSGQLLVDAQLGPRRTGKFPVPASVVIAPQIYITQGQVTDVKNGNTVTSRSVVLTIELRKASGEISVNRTITLEAGGLLGGGSYSTDPKGQATMTLTRNLTAGSSFQKFPLSVSLGQIRQPFTVTL